MRSSTSPLAVSMMMGTSDVSRMTRQTRSPGTRGSMRFENDQIEMVLLELLQGVLAVTDGGHPVVLALEVGGHRIADGLLIFNQKNASRFVAHGMCSLHTRLQFLGCPSLNLC